MKAILMAATLWAATQAVGAEVRIPQICYDTALQTQFCTQTNVGKVQVFVYNAGWCPPCNDEIRELSQSYSQFVNQPVVFASLSGEGYSRGSKPDLTFLKSWKARHNIPFVVAGKFRDFGQQFSSPGSIPFTVIVDKKGNVSQSGFMSSSQIVSQVRKLLAED